MIFYRLVICRFIKYLGIDEIRKERERLDILLGRKKKPIYVPRLNMDENMKTLAFLIVAIIYILFMLTLPLKILENPCEVFKYDMPNFYAFTVTVKEYETTINGIMVVLSGALIYVSCKTILDAIAVTEIKSPWLAQGKYQLPKPGDYEKYLQEQEKIRQQEALYYRQLYQQKFGRKYKLQSDYDEDPKPYYDKGWEAINHKHNQILIESYGIMVDRIFDSDFDRFK